MTEGWVCVESCPIHLLDEMSGERPAGDGKDWSKSKAHGTGNRNAYGVGMDVKPTGQHYSDSGGASKFFKTFPPETEDNLIEPVQEVSSVQILRGDCVEEMAKMAESSIDSIVCDPPYGIAFMNKDFDKLGESKAMQAWHEVWAREALRVLKPGGFLLAFGGTRTVHRLTCAIEDAGFEIRDTIQWIYGSGFPKSAKVIPNLTPRQKQVRAAHGLIPKAGLETAQRWGGFGSSVKPAHEPVVVARRPLSEKSLRAQFFKHFPAEEYGTGMLNIGASRVGYQSENDKDSAIPQGKATSRRKPNTLAGGGQSDPRYEFEKQQPTGRFPSNTLWSHVPGPNGCVRVGSRRVKGAGSAKGYPNGPKGHRFKFDSAPNNGNDYQGYADPDGLEEVPEYICEESCPIKALNEMSGNVKGATSNGKKRGNGYHENFGEQRQVAGYKDQGGASRFFQQFHDPHPGFFYTSKASKKDRTGNGAVENGHPTCKPTELMKYLVRLVSPPNGIVLDPFCGSGTTGVACVELGYNFIGIEQDESYADIAEKRIFYHSLPEAERVDVPTPKQVGERMKKGEVKTAKEWGLTNMHPQDMLLRYDPDERPEEGGTYSPVKEAWEDKRTGPEPDDLTFREVVEKYASALSKTEEQFKDKLF